MLGAKAPVRFLPLSLGCVSEAEQSGVSDFENVSIGEMSVSKQNLVLGRFGKARFRYFSPNNVHYHDRTHRNKHINGRILADNWVYRHSAIWYLCEIKMGIIRLTNLSFGLSDSDARIESECRTADKAGEYCAMYSLQAH